MQTMQKCVFWIKISFFVEEEKNGNDKELKAEFEIINNLCGNVTNELLCRFHEACIRLSTDLENTDQSSHELCIMCSDLREHFKPRETKWTQMVTDLMNKCKSVNNDDNRQIDVESLNDNEDVNETKHNVVENVIENAPHSFLNETMSDQMSFDENSRRSEQSPKSYDSDCDSEQCSLNMEQKFLTEKHAHDEDN